MSEDNNVACSNCNEMKDKTDFYISYNPIHKSGRLPYCKACLRQMISNEKGIVSVDKLKKTLQILDRPFMYGLWESALLGKGDSFGMYMKNLVMPQNRGLTWKDSQLEPKKENGLNYDVFFNPSKNFEITDKIVEKWGGGYKLEEYEAFERKYDLLKNHYPEKTSMHTEALLKYIRYSVKEELATASDDVSDAKAWGALAKDAATAAKINPSQLSASDLQDGLTTFGQLARAVEQAVDVIPILPKFKSKPQDSPDFTLWCYINYIRDLKGLPLCEYEDIYRFYEERKKEYDDRKDFISSKKSSSQDYEEELEEE